MTWETSIENANRRIQELEAEVLRLKGEMEYLENDTIPWLKRELEWERRRMGK